MSDKVVLHKASEFLVLSSENEAKVKRALTANLGNSTLGRFELPKVKTPGSGGTTWEIPSVKGDVSVKEIVGIIVHWEDGQSFWAKSFDETGGEPPDCESKDGITGFGQPGGSCAACPMNDWESAEKGQGKACKVQRVLYILQQGSILPIVYQVPPTGYRVIKDFFNQMASEVIPFYGAVVGLSLAKGKSKANKDGKGGNIDYAYIVPRLISELSEEEIVKIEAYMKSLKVLDSEKPA